MGTRPIGVMDSGVGGLTVLKEIQEQLPKESTLYIGDSKNAPYGDRAPEEIYQLATRMIKFLLKKQVKLIVIACNVITVTSIEKLRNDFPQIPIVGTVPVVKKAVEVTKNGKIGILSTNRTAQSAYQKNLLITFGKGKDILNVGTNKWVPLIERAEFEAGETKKAIKDVLYQFKEKQVDVLALGCTHFPFFRKEIEGVLGPSVEVLDSGGAVARQVKRILENNNELANTLDATHAIYTTGEGKLVKKISKKIIDTPFSISHTVLQ